MSAVALDPARRPRPPLMLLAPPPAHMRALSSAVTLPDDVASLILERLESARDVAVCRSVCRKWRRIIDLSRVLWPRLSFDVVPRAHAAAAAFYRYAASRGNSHAAFLLAILYSYGYKPACAAERRAVSAW
jgi:F-box-like